MSVFLNKMTPTVSDLHKPAFKTNVSYSPSSKTM